MRIAEVLEQLPFEFEGRTVHVSVGLCPDGHHIAAVIRSEANGWRPYTVPFPNTEELLHQMLFTAERLCLCDSWAQVFDGFAFLEAFSAWGTSLATLIQAREQGRLALDTSGRAH